MLADGRPRLAGVSIGDELGCGGFARVWAAVRDIDGAALALKVSHIAGADATARFADEARALAAVGPPAAPLLHATGTLADGRPYLAMERVEGSALSAMLGAIRGIGRVGTPPDIDSALASVWAASRAVLASLHAVHERGWLHLDLKPDNAMMAPPAHGEPRRCVLIDFGSSRSGSTGVSADLGLGGDVVFASVQYAAPERLAGRPVLDRRADIYSFGVILFELLTGRLPFQGDRESIVRGHAVLRPARPSALAPVPALVEALCLACLAKRPDDRPGDASALAAELDEAFRHGRKHRRRELRRLRRVSTEPAALIAADRQPVVLLAVSGAPSPAAVSSVLDAHGGFVARRLGSMFVCAFVARTSHSPWRAALLAARDLASRPGVGAALHVVEARVRPGSPPRIYGEAIDRSKTWTPEAPWTGVLISRALAEVLPAGLVQPVRAPFAAPGEPGESGDGSDTWFRPAAPGPLMTGDHERYVGQAAALARGRASLRASLARAEPGLCTIVGGHGMGKSRLCVELTRMIAEEAPDISPLLVQASRVAPGCPDPVLDALAREIARVTGESPHASAVSDPAAVSALGDGLRRAASVEPLAILVDDCHHASDALLSVLEYAALDADSERADDDDPPRVPLWICVAAGRSLLRRRPRWGQRGERHVSIELEPLSDAEAAELAAALLRPVDYPPPELLDQLVEMSAGNPFLLVQICRNLKRLGMIRRGQQAGSFYIASEATGALPNLSVSQWLAGHELAQLPAPLAAFARVCAVLGGDFTRDELRRAVADAERDDTASTPLDIDVGLAMLERRGLIARDASAPDAGVRDAWSFVKPLFQDAIYRELAVADRTRIHRSASAHWRERADAASGPERERALVAIARHAEALRDHPAAIEAHLALGERARFAHRYVEADWHYTRALALIAEAEARDSIASRDSIAALRGRGVVRYRLHRLHESIQDLQSAAQIAERAGLVTDFIASLLEQSTSLDWAGEYSASAECVERAGERMEPDAEPGLRARYLTALGRSQYRRGDTASAIATLTEAHRSHEAVGDAEWAIITLLLLAPLLSFAGRVSDAEARFADAVALCEQHRDRFHLCVAYLNRAWLWLAEPDEPAEAIRHVLGDLHRARRIARQIGQPILERGAAHNIAEILHWSGKQRRALAHARRALTLQRFLPEPVVTDVLLVARAHAAARNWGEAKHHTERSRTIADAKPGSVQPGESLLLRALEQVVGDLADRGDERRARWGEISASADAELPAEERLEILYFRALDAERAGDREALGEALCSAREQLERTPLLTGLFAEITARSGAEPAQTG